MSMRHFWKEKHRCFHRHEQTQHPCNYKSFYNQQSYHSMLTYQMSLNIDCVLLVDNLTRYLFVTSMSVTATCLMVSLSTSWHELHAQAHGYAVDILRSRFTFGLRIRCQKEWRL